MTEQTSGAAPAPSLLAPIIGLQLPDPAAMRTPAERILDFVERFDVRTREDYDLAAEELVGVKRRKDAHEALRTSITGPLNNVLRSVNALFKPASDLYDRCEATLKIKCGAWIAEQERIAAEARRAAEEAAQAERARIAREAEERQREAVAAAQRAAAATAAGNETAAAIAQAEAARCNAQAATAATVAQLIVAPPIAPPAHAAGLSSRTSIDFHVVSLAHLVEFIATGRIVGDGERSDLKHPEFLALLCADEKRIRQTVLGLGIACSIPGIRVFPKTIVAVKRGTT